MNSETSTRKLPWLYFALVFLLSIPFWLLGSMVERFLPRGITINLPISALMFVCPFIAASLLVYREGGWSNVKQLWQRAIDYRRMPGKIWFLPMVLLMPLIMLLEYGVMRMTGVSVPGFQVPVWLVPISLAVFFISGCCEEIGWSGYATDPLQDRWGALRAGIIIGAVWAIWHIVPYLQADNTPAWVAWQCAVTVGNRILIIWLYNNTGKSVFAASVLHAMYDVCFLVVFPIYGSFYNPFITAVLLTVTSAIVVYIWGSRTLARYRYA